MTIIIGFMSDHQPNAVIQNSVTQSSFKSTDSYIATDSLKLAVNAAIQLQKPLLIKGEPGTGKTLLAEEVAKSLGMPLLTWHINLAHQSRTRLV